MVVNLVTDHEDPIWATDCSQDETNGSEVNYGTTVILLSPSWGQILWVLRGSNSPAVSFLAKGSVKLHEPRRSGSSHCWVAEKSGEKGGYGSRKTTDRGQMEERKGECVAPGVWKKWVADMTAYHYCERLYHSAVCHITPIMSSPKSYS